MSETLLVSILRCVTGKRKQTNERLKASITADITLCWSVGPRQCYDNLYFLKQNLAFAMPKLGTSQS